MKAGQPLFCYDLFKSGYVWVEVMAPALNSKWGQVWIASPVSVSYTIRVERETVTVSDESTARTPELRQQWAMTREITNRLDRLIALDEEFAEQSRMRRSRTNNRRDVNEPPDSIPCLTTPVTHLNLAEQQRTMNEQIVSGDLVLELVVGNHRYKGVLTEDSMHGTTVLTRIP